MSSPEETAAVAAAPVVAAPSAPAAAPVPGRRLPDFFIVGHPKSGTTALYEMLRCNSQIFMCEEKEPWYFSPELRFRPPPRKPFVIPETLDHYLSLFELARPEQRVGEASTTYLWSEAAASLIAEVCPQARIIAILREPASFLRSLHLQFVEAHIETERDFGRAIALEGARREHKNIARHSYWPQLLGYSDHVRYAEQLRRYHAAFPPEQVLVLIYDDFRADNEGTVHQVLRFLGVDDAAPVERLEANSTVQARSRAVHELMHAVTVGRGPLSRGFKTVVTAVTPAGVRRRLLQAVWRRVVYREPHVADEQVMAELRRRFKPEVEALSEYLGRDLVALWGYDNVD
jgi:hypothetical protein